MLAIAGGKGGNRRTTATLGLASALDDPVFTAGADRDMPSPYTMVGIGRLMDTASGTPVREPSVRSHPADSTVSVLPTLAGTDGDAFEWQFRTTAGDERRVVVNCPAGIGPDTATPFRVADGVVVVLLLCTPAFRDTARTTAMAWAFGTPVVGCVISRSRVIPETVSDLVGAPVFGIVPKESSPVLTRSTVRTAYRRIVDKIPGKKQYGRPPYVRLCPD